MAGALTSAPNMIPRGTENMFAITEEGTLITSAISAHDILTMVETTRNEDPNREPDSDDLVVNNM